MTAAESLRDLFTHAKTVNPEHASGLPSHYLPDAWVDGSKATIVVFVRLIEAACANAGVPTS
jgi:hypothetical protein